MNPNLAGAPPTPNAIDLADGVVRILRDEIKGLVVQEIERQKEGKATDYSNLHKLLNEKCGINKENRSYTSAADFLNNGCLLTRVHIGMHSWESGEEFLVRELKLPIIRLKDSIDLLNKTCKQCGAQEQPEGLIFHLENCPFKPTSVPEAGNSE